MINNANNFNQDAITHFHLFLKQESKQFPVSNFADKMCVIRKFNQKLHTDDLERHWLLVKIPVAIFHVLTDIRCH